MTAMAAQVGSLAGPSHPSPARGRVSTTLLLFALAAGPAVWITQLVVNYGLASYSCYPRWRPAPAVLPGWHGIWWGQLAINLVAIVIALAATALCYRDWRLTRGEHPGASEHALEAGEGRTRFLALVGVMSGLGFAAAALFDTVALLGVPLCAG